jgi:hypothetical protein
VKKLISIGVALALLTMAVVPGVAAAYTTPDTYSKVPFAIIQSGFELIGDLLTALGGDLGLPDYLNETLMDTIGGWAGGPLSWTVDMLAWGLDLGGSLWATIDGMFGLGYTELGDLLSDVACGLMMCWSATNCTGTFDPCA